MPGTHIKYRGGYKYQLVEEYAVEIAVKPAAPIDHDYIALDTEGLISIRRGYAWDGPSGPTIDTKTFMRGSLVHDALYQLMREGRLDKDTWRETADKELKRLCLEDGMWSLRAWWVYRAVRDNGDPSASPESRKPIETAP